MKKIILLGMLAIYAVPKIVACNICGGGGASGFMGVLPQYQKNYLTLRYQTRSFQTIHPPSIIPGLGGQKSNEKYASTEIMGRYCIGKRFQTIALMQYRQMEQDVAQASYRKQGFGDPTAMVYYALVPSNSDPHKKFKQIMQFGLGIKIPLGKNDIISENDEYNPVFQPGTGSWDKLLSVVYSNGLSYEIWSNH